MRLTPRFLITAIGLLLATVGLRAAEANPVLFWNTQVLNASRLSRNPPPIMSLHLATYHAAIFEAVNGINRRWQPWEVTELAPQGSDRDAAIAAAARKVLVELWGNAYSPILIQKAYDEALAKIADGPAKTDGIAYGEKAAAAVLARRAKSGWNAAAPGAHTSTEAGKWRETPPGFRPPVTPQVATTVPYVMKTPDQFRAPPPQKIDSKEYAEEIAFVEKVGPRDNAERTEYQTLSTPFWADDLGSATPAGHWNEITQDLTNRNNLSVEDTAHLYALLNFACADAGISCWDSKYYYRTWRPESAIREEDRKFNPLVIHNPNFIPNMEAPAHPDYTSGHSTFTGAATRLLELYFGTDEIEFTTLSDGLPGAVRTFTKLSDARREVGMSRIYGGIHTMSANIEGQKAGIAIADYVFTTALQPIAPKAAK